MSDVTLILRDKKRLKKYIEEHGNKTTAMKALGVSSPCFGFWTLVHNLTEGNHVGPPRGWDRLEKYRKTGELRRWLRDMTVSQISRETGIKPRTIYAFLYRKGLVRIPGWQEEAWTKEMVTKAIHRARGELSEVCKILGGDEKILREYLDEHKLWGVTREVQDANCLLWKLAKKSESEAPLDDRALEVLLGLRQFLSLQEIGDLFGVTKERVRQVEEELLRRSSYAAIT